MKKLITILSVGMLLIPGFLSSGVAYAETKDLDNLTATTELLTSQPETTDSTTAASKTNEPAKTAQSTESTDTSKESTAVEPKEMTDTKETTTAETTADSAEATLTEDQFKQLQAKLPEGTTIEFTDGKLIIELPAGVDPEVAKKAYAELGLKVPVEIRAKHADAVQTDSYKYGAQVFKTDMSKKTGDLATVAKVVSGEMTAIDSGGDYGKGIAGNSKFSWNIFGYYNYSLGGFTMNPTEFKQGYDAARQAYITEMKAYLDQIKNVGMTERDQLANSTAYGPNAEDSSSKFWGLIGTAAKSGLDLIANIPLIGDFLQWIGLSATPLDKKLPDVWKYDANKPLNADAANFADYYNTGVAPKISTLVQSSQKNMINYIGVVLPTVQNILVKRTLQDPRALGGLNGVNDILPNHLSEALALNVALDKVTSAFGFSGAIGSSISDTIYLSIRNAVATSLVEHGQEGSTMQIQYVLNDTKPSQTTFLSINDSHKEGETTTLAHDAFYTFSQYYLQAVKSTAMQDAMNNIADKSDTTLVDYIFDNYSTLVTGDAAKLSVAFSKTGEMNPSAGVTPNNYSRLQDSTGQAARAFLLAIYKAEKLSITQAMTDFLADPFTDPRTMTDAQKNAVKFINPNKINASGDSPEPVPVADYMKVRTWLYVASLDKIKNGMHDADLKSHARTDSKDIAKISEDGTTTIDPTSLKNANATLTVGLDDDLLTTYQTQLQKLITSKNIYAISYNAEVPRVNGAFTAAYQGFDNLVPLIRKDYQNTNIIGIGQKFESDPTLYSRAKIPTQYTMNEDTTSILFTKNDGEKNMRGIAFQDGLMIAFKEKGVKVTVIPTPNDESKTEFADITPTPKNITQYATTADKTIDVDITVPDGWEIKNYASDTKTVPVDVTNPTKSANASDSPQFTKESKILYNKLIIPEITEFMIGGNTVDGFTITGKTSTPKTTVVTLDNGLGSGEVDQDGNFSITIAKDKLKIGDTVSGTATFTNLYGTKTTSQPAQAKVTGSLGFNITTSDGSNTLLWTNRTLVPGVATFTRDAGNKIVSSVVDQRPDDQKKNGWKLMVQTAGAENEYFNFLWNGQVLQNDASIQVEDSNADPGDANGVSTKEYAENQGIQLQSKQTIPIGEYKSTAGNSQTIVWTLQNTLDPE